MFKQLIKDGYQAEVPDIWLTEGNPWEVKRHDIRFEVGFSGKTSSSNGKTTWTPGEKVSGLDAAVADACMCCALVFARYTLAVPKFLLQHTSSSHK